MEWALFNVYRTSRKGRLQQKTCVSRNSWPRLTQPIHIWLDYLVWFYNVRTCLFSFSMKRKQTRQTLYSLLFLRPFCNWYYLCVFYIHFNVFFYVKVVVLQLMAFSFSVCSPSIIMSWCRIEAIVESSYYLMKLLAKSQYSEGAATGNIDKGFSWFPCA